MCLTLSLNLSLSLSLSVSQEGVSYEVRRYDACKHVCVSLEGRSFDQVSSDLQRKLLAYMSGDNEQGEPISAQQTDMQQIRMLQTNSQSERCKQTDIQSQHFKLEVDRCIGFAD